MFMFDTNAMSALVHRAKGFERIAERVAGLSYGERLLSAISLSELQTMIEKAAQPRGTAIGPLDTLIAAHARSVGATVVTDNIAEFRRIPDLHVENWQR